METNVKPTHEQGQLQLQLYDLRREARLRQARDWFTRDFNAETFEEAMRIAPPGSEPGAHMGMVMGYWEQACAYLNHGLLHEGLFFETSGEFFMVWERLRAFVPEARERFGNTRMLLHIETAARRYEAWMEASSPGTVEKMRQMMKQMRAQSAAKA